ncbi:MAG TPA: prepilin-type N-terminal cleavage/methylation domain-containing protein [Candidatus Acidoferrales bacterium]|nr:prepilin-type N-terminal cleavage/methylation domain-containing protein [Candidatus Acidoferrales bacterium]
MNRQITQPDGSRNPSRKRCEGFSVVELMIVVVIVLIVAAISIPGFLTMIHNAKLQGAASDFGGLLQKARIRAVQDDVYYATYFTSSGTLLEAYVDVKKLVGSTALDATVDPMVSMSSEVSVVAAGSAPNTSALQGLFLPTGSTLTVNDGASSSSPVIFNSRGLPCTSISVSGGTLCSSSSTYTTAYWLFFQDNITHAWVAVTISPAGRIQKWRADGSSWVKD